MSDKLSLKWNDYQSNWNKALNDLRKDTDFSDVTLITDDKVKFSAHRILLSSCSNLFKFILKSSTQANSLLYLGGVSSISLGFILDYIYHGEVNLYQEQLDSFLESAQKLEIQGLLGDNRDNLDNLNEEPEQDIGHIKNDINELTEDKSLVRIDNAGNKMRRQYSKSSSKDVTKFDVSSMTSEEIGKKMKELYEKTNEGWRCLACDHTNNGRMSSNIRMHVETHLDGLVYTCNICNKDFRCRSDLNNHKKAHTHNK